MSIQSVPIDQLRDVQASLAGDGEAFARLVHRHQHRIAAYLWRFTRDRNTWEELTQEVFVQAYISLRGFRGQVSLEHWLLRIATRVGYRFWKQRRRQLDREVQQQQLPVLPRPDSLSPGEIGEYLHTLLARLPPRDRLVLTLMYLREQSVEEIAALTGWSKTLVKVQAHRARNRLRKLVEAEESQS